MNSQIVLFHLFSITIEGTLLILSCSINPFSPNIDQHQFSPNDIHRMSRAKSMRINKMITKRKIFDLLSNSLN